MPGPKAPGLGEFECTEVLLFSMYKECFHMRERGREGISELWRLFVLMGSSKGGRK